MKIDHLCHEKLVFKQISTSQRQISFKKFSRFAGRVLSISNALSRRVLRVVDSDFAG